MLDDLALTILLVVGGLVVCGCVGVDGIRYEIAKARRHPHQDAIAVSSDHWVAVAVIRRIPRRMKSCLNSLG